MKILVISSLYPKRNIDDNNGIFIQQQLLALYKYHHCDISVISPIPYVPPFLSSIKTKWSKYKSVPYSDNISGINVFYPRYFRPPGEIFYGSSSNIMDNNLGSFIRSQIRIFKPDIVQAYNGTPQGYVAAKTGLRYKIPVIVSFRGDDTNSYPSYTGNLNKTIFVINNSTIITTVSYDLKKKLGLIASSVKPIKVIYNGCNNKMFYPNKKAGNILRKHKGFKKNDIIIVFLGNGQQEQKGVVDAIISFNYLKKRISNVKFLFLGYNNLNAKVNNRLKNTSLDDIYFAGKIKHNEIGNYLNIGDIFILPSWKEGLPNALLEAMACGLPVVASNVGGIPEVIKHSENGFLVEPGDHITLYKYIELLILNRNLRETIKLKARTTIVNNFTWEKSSSQLFTLYKDTIKDYVRNSRYN